MTTVHAIHGIDTDKLAGVIEEMKERGAPVIRVVDCGDYYFALEGCHRLAAAVELGLTPEFEVFEQDDEISIESYDWYQADPQNWAGTVYPAGEVAGELSSMSNVPYSFERR